MRQAKNDIPPATRRRGAALVELTIVLFLLLLVVFGCVDFGRFALTAIAVASAAREGANVGSLHPTTQTTQELWKQKIRDAVVEEMSGVPGFSEDQLTLADPLILASDTSARVEVQVTYPFDAVVPWIILPRRMEISRKAVMPVVRY